MAAPKETPRGASLQWGTPSRQTLMRKVVSWYPMDERATHRFVAACRQEGRIRREIQEDLTRMAPPGALY